MNSKPFWIAQNLTLLAIYAAGLALVLMGHSQHFLVLLSAVLLGAHALEIPVAFKVLKHLNPAPLRLVLGTLLFGFTWWLPVKRGVYAPR